MSTITAPSVTLRKFSKMNSERLLNAIASGRLSAREARAAAKVAERRFPTPKKK